MLWNLDSIYTSFDSKKYKEDFNLLKEEVENFSNQYKKVKHVDNNVIFLENFVKENINIMNLMRRIGAYISLNLSVNVSNIKAKRELDKLISISSNLTAPITNFQYYLKDIDNLDNIIDKSKLLKEHAFYLKELKDETRYLLSPVEEEIIEKMQATGSSAWSNLHGKLTSTLLIDYEGKMLPLSAIRNLAYHSSKDVRKKAYELELESYKKIEEPVASILNSIKGEVLTTSKMRGFDSPLEETLYKSRMKKETLEAMFTAIDEYLPVFQKYLKKKSEKLGYKNGLPFYELFAPVQSINKEYTFEQAHEYIVDKFSNFSCELSNFADYAFKNNWIDAKPREGKRGGAFCMSIHPIGESRIMANFDGSFSNTITLAHELGHGYHGNILKEESILNTSYPMPLAETASIFSETIVTDAALKIATDEEKIGILESSISDATQTIVDIYSRFIFEYNFFKERNNHTLTVEEIKDLMLDAQKKAYGEGLDHEYLHPYMWVNKSHYYSAGRNFYNFPYAFGLLFSKGLYAQYLTEGDKFIEKYNRILRETGKNSIEDVAMIADIDVTNPEFFRGSLNLIKEEIEELIELL